MNNKIKIKCPRCQQYYSEKPGIHAEKCTAKYQQKQQQFPQQKMEIEEEQGSNKKMQIDAQEKSSQQQRQIEKHTQSSEKKGKMKILQEQQEENRQQNNNDVCQFCEESHISTYVQFKANNLQHFNQTYHVPHRMRFDIQQTYPFNVWHDDDWENDDWQDNDGFQILNQRGQQKRQDSLVQQELKNLKKAQKQYNIDYMSKEELYEYFTEKDKNILNGFEDYELKKLQFQTYQHKLKDEEQNSCGICLEPFELGNEYLNLECLHLFHKECALKWLIKNKHCPICKKEVRL